MKIHIKSDDGMPSESTITLEDGTPLEKVTAVDIQIRPQEPIKAQLQFVLLPVDFIAEASVSEEHLRELAEAHGFDLVKKESGAI